MSKPAVMLWLAALAWAASGASAAGAYDLTASVGDSSPAAAQADPGAPYRNLVRVIEAMDRATNRSTRVVLRPFARSLQETAAGHADFHVPFIQVDGSPPPSGLAYVEEVDFGLTHFVVYSRKSAPLDARSVATAPGVEVEPGHDRLFTFPVRVTVCIPCSLDKVLIGRADALVVASGTVDPLLGDPKYRGIHRALFGSFPTRALVPSAADSRAARRYLLDGVSRIKASGELWRLLPGNRPYVDWQP
jgi:hypothetical protein